VVQQDFICGYCDQVGIQYDDQQNMIAVPLNIPHGLYRVKIILADNDELDPKTKEYIIDIFVINEFNNTDLSNGNNQTSEGETKD